MEEEVDYGLAISDYNIQQGTYGFTMKVDVSENLPFDVKWVQAENAGGVRTAVSKSPTTDLETLLDYLETESCPVIAWYYADQTLHIFFSNYDGDDELVRFAFGGNRKAQKVSADSEYIDVPPERMELVQLYAKNLAYYAKKRKYDEDLMQRIEEIEHEIRT